MAVSSLPGFHSPLVPIGKEQMEKNTSAETRFPHYESRKCMNFADNECAQALLDLAQSSTPVEDVGAGQDTAKCDMFSPQSLFSISSALYQHDQSGSFPPDAQVLKGKRAGTRGIFKRHVEGAEKKNVTFLVDPSTAVEIKTGSSCELQQELVKRIRLDHNYQCPGDFNWNRYVKSINSNESMWHNSRRENFMLGSDDVKENMGKSGFLGKDKRKNLNYSADKVHDWFGRHSVAPTEELNPPATGAKGGNTKLEYGGFLSEASIPSLVNPGFSSDVYAPEDKKYKNFNLLLKCLTDDLDTSACRSQQLSSDPSEEQDSRIPEQQNAEGDAKLQCSTCSRTFLKKRYLTKHIRRMHPHISVSPPRSDEPVLCPNCGYHVPQQTFRKHSQHCAGQASQGRKPESDLASCQFCGIHMRRHILVKHLAQEHCVESPRDDWDPDLSGDDISETDSSTLSGSEHEVSLDLPTPESASPKGESENGQERMPADTDSCHSSNTTASASGSCLEPDIEKSVASSGSLPLIACQLCGKECSIADLKDHLLKEHRVASPLVSNAISQKAKHDIESHSALQQFLENSQNVASMAVKRKQDKGECQSCMDNLPGGSSPDDDGYVSSNNNRVDNATMQASTPMSAIMPTMSSDPAWCQSRTLSATNTTYTIVITKDNKRKTDLTSERVAGQIGSS